MHDVRGVSVRFGPLVSLRNSGRNSVGKGCISACHAEDPGSIPGGGSFCCWFGNRGSCSTHFDTTQTLAATTDQQWSLQWLNMYPRAGESIITRTLCPLSNMEVILPCRREHHAQNNICQQFVYKGNIVQREIQWNYVIVFERHFLL